MYYEILSLFPFLCKFNLPPRLEIKGNGKKFLFYQTLIIWGSLKVEDFRFLSSFLKFSANLLILNYSLFLEFIFGFY